jgi:hypothetical protein
MRFASVSRKQSARFADRATPLRRMEQGTLGHD